MLVLSRRENEQIKLGDSIVVTIVKVTGDRVRLGIKAPSDVLVLRSELKGRDVGDADTLAQIGVTDGVTAGGHLTVTGLAVSISPPSVSSGSTS
ncbi:MAG: carbon storage regulator [Pirellulales bacterium]